MQPQRRLFKQTDPLEQRLAQEALRLKKLADDTPPGAKRDWLRRRARQCEIGSHMSAWLRFTGVQPPR